MAARRKAHGLYYVDRSGTNSYELLGLAQNTPANLLGMGVGLETIPRPERDVLGVLLHHVAESLYSVPIDDAPATNVVHQAVWGYPDEAVCGAHGDNVTCVLPGEVYNCQACASHRAGTP